MKKDNILKDENRRECLISVEKRREREMTLWEKKREEKRKRWSPVYSNFSFFLFSFTNEITKKILNINIFVGDSVRKVKLKFNDLGIW
jgi:hypothetical protein